MPARNRGLRRALPSARELRRAARHGLALAQALVAAGLVLAATLAVWSAAGWGTPSFAMSKMSRVDLGAPARDAAPRAAAANPVRVPDRAATAAPHSKAWSV
jgi:hypothetical protein